MKIGVSWLLCPGCDPGGGLANRTRTRKLLVFPRGRFPSLPGLPGRHVERAGLATSVTKAGSGTRQSSVFGPAQTEVWRPLLSTSGSCVRLRAPYIFVSWRFFRTIREARAWKLRSAKARRDSISEMSRHACRWPMPRCRFGVSFSTRNASTRSGMNIAVGVMKRSLPSRRWCIWWPTLCCCTVAAVDAVSRRISPRANSRPASPRHLANSADCRSR